MTPHPDRDARVDLISRSSSATIEIRIVVLAPGCEWGYDESEWRDSLLEIEQGYLDVEFCSGDVRRFTPGDVLWLAGLPVRALHNRGSAAIVLVAASRRQPDSPDPVTAPVST